MAQHGTAMWRKGEARCGAAKRSKRRSASGQRDAKQCIAKAKLGEAVRS